MIFEWEALNWNQLGTAFGKFSASYRLGPIMIPKILKFVIESGKDNLQELRDILPETEAILKKWYDPEEYSYITPISIVSDYCNHLGLPYECSYPVFSIFLDMLEMSSLSKDIKTTISCGLDCFYLSYYTSETLSWEEARNFTSPLQTLVENSLERIENIAHSAPDGSSVKINLLRFILYVKKEISYNDFQNFISYHTN